MASKKRKSIGTRLTSQYDTRRFSSLDVWTKYTDNVMGRNILPERKVELYHTELDDFKAELEMLLRTVHQSSPESEGHPGKILRKDLTTLAQVWSVLSYSNLAPTSHTSDLTMDRARLIFGLVSRLDMNIGALIFGQMTSIAQSNTSRLGFPALITTLCRARGVFSDSLTFEHLSPVINLAYIRNNCWNPEDLTVSIQGARRARARPVELLLLL
ncbi:hypothetical protein GmHk_19G054800 [Glycine max]|nr:hypothetical protein GmHk_19G054800 [Glycine max]